MKVMLDDDEMETVRNLIRDWDLISSPATKTDYDKMIALGDKLGMVGELNRG